MKLTLELANEVLTREPWLAELPSEASPLVENLYSRPGMINIPNKWQYIDAGTFILSVNHVAGYCECGGSASLQGCLAMRFEGWFERTRVARKDGDIEGLAVLCAARSGRYMSEAVVAHPDPLGVAPG